MSPESAAFSKAAPADAVFTFTGGGLTLTSLKIGSTAVNAANYTFADNVLTLTGEYLATLANGDKTFNLVLNGGSFALVITVGD
ncbi:MAG: X2-like carbohydrate binding domain-containing protein [Cloacibacillus sp.]